jgi:hypothetical protein
MAEQIERIFEAMALHRMGRDTEALRLIRGHVN